ncbi:C39 family peptidase [Streptomyces sp. RS10V-4]|uniref:C39 family peptidase n=1 Tax=Streptomyces rhizoryzae TaxID=2932493 RepID=UPI00200638C7|nr:C39 family peptidase [Streptomyces rhizoryzae]MCK7625226.1 C39 family peptidase [Streptomyces rhizoryzae]
MTSDSPAAPAAPAASTVIHPVPYHAQWASPDLVPAILDGSLPAAEDPRWPEYGADDPEEYAWWSWRLCGVACLRMALGHWRGAAPTAMELAAECLAAGAYVRHADGLHGLVYAPFASYVERRWGLAARSRPDLPRTELPALLHEGQLVLLSVHPSIRDADPAPPHRGGHLVLAVGVTPGHVVVHNPSGLPGHSQEFAPVPWAKLDRVYAGRGVVLGPGN